MKVRRNHSTASFGGEQRRREIVAIRKTPHRADWERRAALSLPLGSAPSRLTRRLARDLQLDGEPASALRKSYGARPGEDFVRDAWPLLRDEWLAKDGPVRRSVVAQLRERRLGDPDLPVRRAQRAGDPQRAAGVRPRQALAIAWIQLGGRLTSALTGLTPYETLVIELPSAFDETELTGATPYLQFMAYGEDLVRGELSSNHVLDVRHRLPDAQGCSNSAGPHPHPTPATGRTARARISRSKLRQASWLNSPEPRSPRSGTSSVSRTRHF